jgi:hypothetical protein
VVSIVKSSGEFFSRVAEIGELVQRHRLQITIIGFDSSTPASPPDVRFRIKADHGI